jgi:hypothetical protein
MIEWSDEAVEAALSQLKASRFSNMTHHEAMRQVLYAASNAQARFEKEDEDDGQPSENQEWRDFDPDC